MVLRNQVYRFPASGRHAVSMCGRCYTSSAVPTSPAPTSSCPSPVPPCIQQKHVSPRCHCQRGFCRCTSLLCCERSPGQVSCQSILSTVCLVSGGASVVVVQMLEGGASYRCFSRALFSVCSVSFSRSHVFLSFSSPSLHTAEACQPQMSLSKRLLPLHKPVVL